MRMSCAMMALSLLLSAVPAAAQTRTITGTVTDGATGQPLEGARVAVRGTALVVTTGADGKFTLGNVPQGNVVLAIRRIGNNFVDLPLPAGQNELRVTLTRDPLRLSDVVVTGQATTVDRRNLANAVATVSGEEVSRVSAQTVEQALQGKVVGASIQANSGAPGGGMQMRLRGVTSINGSSEPLYVVDGVVVSNVAIPSNQNAVTRSTQGSNPSLTQDAQVNRIADLNPNDIENVEVLKGASASAIYGSRASNGVVIITTRRGRPVMDKCSQYQCHHQYHQYHQFSTDFQGRRTCDSAIRGANPPDTFPSRVPSRTSRRLSCRRRSTSRCA